MKLQNGEKCPVGHPLDGCKEPTLQRADFTRQPSLFETSKGERNMFIIFLLSNFCPLMSPLFQARLRTTGQETALFTVVSLDGWIFCLLRRQFSENIYFTAISLFFAESTEPRGNRFTTFPLLLLNTPLTAVYTFAISSGSSIIF